MRDRRRRENPIIFNNKECHIKGRTSTSLDNCVAKEIRSGTMRHVGMHDFYQFNYWNLNLRQRGSGVGKRDFTQWGASFFWAHRVCENDHRCKTEAWSKRDPHLNSLRLMIRINPSGDWRRLIWLQMMLTDQLQDFINFCGQSISRRGEWSFNGTWKLFGRSQMLIIREYILLLLSHYRSSSAATNENSHNWEL